MEFLCTLEDGEEKAVKLAKEKYRNNDRLFPFIIKKKETEDISGLIKSIKDRNDILTNVLISTALVGIEEYSMNKISTIIAYDSGHTKNAYHPDPDERILKNKEKTNIEDGYYGDLSDTLFLWDFEINIDDKNCLDSLGFDTQRLTENLKLEEILEELDNEERKMRQDLEKSIGINKISKPIKKSHNSLIKQKRIFKSADLNKDDINKRKQYLDSLPEDQKSEIERIKNNINSESVPKNEGRDIVIELGEDDFLDYSSKEDREKLFGPLDNIGKQGQRIIQYIEDGDKDFFKNLSKEDRKTISIEFINNFNDHLLKLDE